MHCEHLALVPSSFAKLDFFPYLVYNHHQMAIPLKYVGPPNMTFFDDYNNICRQDNSGKVIQVLQNRVSSMKMGEDGFECDFPLWIGSEQTISNKVYQMIMDCVCRAWYGDGVDLVKIMGGLSAFRNLHSHWRSEFSVFLTVNHQQDLHERDTIMPVPCQLIDFKPFPKDGKGFIHSPLILRLKILCRVPNNLVEQLSRSGFFYITGDAELENISNVVGLENNHITDFSVDSLCYRDKYGNEEQVLLSNGDIL